MRIKPLFAVLAALASLTPLAACGGGGDDVGIGYFQSSTLGPEVLVAGNADLAKKIDGKIKLTPIDSGVAGLAELRSGRAFPFVAGVGNPPVVGSIATNTKLKVIYGLYYDAAQLMVPASVTRNDQLTGKTIGDLQGSSEDFEIRGWLKTQHLDNSVKVVGFPSEAAVEAAYKAHKIDAAYVEYAQALDLQKSGARKVVTAQEIAKLGYPSLNVLAVTDAYAKQHPKTVQQVVCQVMKAQTLATGPKADTYIGNAAGTVGSTKADAIAATKVIPFVPAAQQTALLGANGELQKSYALTGKFLVDQGRAKTAPTAQQIASHVDASYAKKALSQGCDK